MLPSRRSFKMRWKFFEEFYIGCQCHAREYSFKQIVAEQRVIRNLSFQRELKSIHIVNSLTGVGALLEEILIDVRNGVRVRINSAGAGKNFLKERSFAITRQRWRNARLDNGIAFRHPTGALVENWKVQRVGHGPDEAISSATRQACIGIKRDYVAHAAWRVRRN